MRHALSAVLAVGMLAAALSLASTAGSCTPFGEEATGADGSVADGGLADGPVEPARPRDVLVEVGWPTVASLDPAKDARASKMRVAVTDVADASRTVQKDLAAVELGPFSFPGFVTSNLVDVVVELRGKDDRLLGYGERRRWNLAASATVPVAARQRLLYFTSRDRDDGQLRALGMTPAAAAEPALDEPALPALASLAEPVGLYVTSDGLLLVQTGRSRLGDGGAGAGAVSVTATASHASVKTIPLPLRPGSMTALGDGHRLLVVPGGGATTFALVDVDGGVVTDVTTGLTGGSIEAWAVAASPDGARAAAVGSYTSSNVPKPYAFFFDAGTGKATSLDLSSVLDVARGVRFTPDGKSLVVAGANDTAAWATGALLVFDASTLGATSVPTRTINLTADKTKSSGLLLHPDGKHAYVAHETRYGTGACCGELRIVDLEAGKEVYASTYGNSGPEFEIVSGVRLPYAPNRVIGGQSDPGNNVHGPVVELTQGGAKPVEVTVDANGDIGSIDDIATPFGSRL